MKNNADKKLLDWFISTAQLENIELTPYKHKFKFYEKRAHYINGKKVNRKLYNIVQKRQIELYIKLYKNDPLELYRNFK